MKFSHTLLLFIALISLMSNIPASAALDTLAVFVMYLHSYSVLAPFVKHPAFVQILRLIFTPTPTTPNINVLPYSPSILLHLFAIVQACLNKSQILKYLVLGETFRHCQAVSEFTLGTAHKLAIQLLQIILPWVHTWVARTVSFGLLLSDNLTWGAIRFIMMLASPSSDDHVYIAFLAYAPLGTIYLTKFSRTFSSAEKDVYAAYGTAPPCKKLHCHFEILRMRSLGNFALSCWAMVTLVLWEPYWEVAMIGAVMIFITIWKMEGLHWITPFAPLNRLIWGLEEYPRVYLRSILALRVAHARVVERMHEANFYLALKRLAERGEVDLALVDPDLAKAMKGVTPQIRTAEATDHLKKMFANYRKAAKIDSAIYEPNDADLDQRTEFQFGETMMDIVSITGDDFVFT